jgi:hypothetical protein
MTKEKKNPGTKERKSKAGFLYLFAALARRASQEKGMSDLQRLSHLIEAEVSELQNTKNTVKLRDAIGKKSKSFSHIE